MLEIAQRAQNRAVPARAHRRAITQQIPTLPRGNVVRTALARRAHDHHQQHSFCRQRTLHDRQPTGTRSPHHKSARERLLLPSTFASFDLTTACQRECQRARNSTKPCSYIENLRSPDSGCAICSTASAARPSGSLLVHPVSQGALVTVWLLGASSHSLRAARPPHGRGRAARPGGSVHQSCRLVYE